MIYNVLDITKLLESSELLIAKDTATHIEPLQRTAVKQHRGPSDEFVETKTWFCYSEGLCSSLTHCRGSSAVSTFPRDISVMVERYAPIARD